MSETFEMRIVTPERTVYSEPIVSLVAPGVDGYFGVLAHHAAMLAEVATGQITVRRADGTRDELAVAGGFLEVREGTVTLLADAAERKQEIDPDRAEAAAERARKRLAEPKTAVDMARAEAALSRAMNRLHVANNH